jgi:hypothetical protein
MSPNVAPWLHPVNRRYMPNDRLSGAKKALAFLASDGATGYVAASSRVLSTAREHARVTPEEFAKHIGESRFAPLICEHLDVFAGFSTVIRTRGLSIRTEKCHLGWCCRFLSRLGGSGPEELGRPMPV